MINNFDKYTESLTDFERDKVLPLLIAGLRTKVGKDAAVSNRYMVSKLKERGVKVSGARIRKLINYIRIRGLIPRLVASSKGYYVSESKEEIRTYIESLRQRRQAIHAVESSLANQLNQFI